MEDCYRCEGCEKKFQASETEWYDLDAMFLCRRCAEHLFVASAVLDVTDCDYDKYKV